MVIRTEPPDGAVDLKRTGDGPMQMKLLVPLSISQPFFLEKNVAAVATVAEAVAEVKAASCFTVSVR